VAKRQTITSANSIQTCIWFPTNRTELRRAYTVVGRVVEKITDFYTSSKIRRFKYEVYLDLNVFFVFLFKAKFERIRRFRLNIAFNIVEVL